MIGIIHLTTIVLHSILPRDLVGDLKDTIKDLEEDKADLKEKNSKQSDELDQAVIDMEDLEKRSSEGKEVFE